MQLTCQKWPKLYPILWQHKLRRRLSELIGHQKFNFDIVRDACQHLDYSSVISDKISAIDELGIPISPHVRLLLKIEHINCHIAGNDEVEPSSGQRVRIMQNNEYQYGSLVSFNAEMWSSIVG